MKRLSRAAFDRARSYIMSYGRPLDRARFLFHFEGGDPAEVLEALAHYQNADGGFGQGLEPDLRAPASSAIATSHGLAFLREIKAPASEAMVGAAVDYLMATFDHSAGVWPIVPPEVEEAPHAPWWDYAASAETFGHFLANPRPELVGHLQHYASLVPPDFLGALTRSVAGYLAEHDGPMGMHDLLSYSRLLATPELDPDLAGSMAYRLMPMAAQTVERDPALWTGYCLKPLDLAPDPDAPLAPAVDPAEVQANLDFEIGRQLEDGSWPLPWSWADMAPEAWARAERDWKGTRAVDNLLVFRTNNRLVP